VSVRPVIRLKAGDDKSVRIGVVNSDGSARDLTGETIEFRAAESLARDDALISKVDGDGIAIVSAVEGLIDVVFTSAETLAGLPPHMLWEVKVTATDGDVTTLDFSSDASDPHTYGILRVERALLLAG
jgi:hypothetical protein